jgi:CHAT domain-containing protein/tetratricopeptide (TPR) repeat protein
LRDFEQHLSPDLFHRLVEAGETDERAPELESAERHLAACAVCRQRLDQFRAAQRGLDGLRLMVSEERMKTADCPPESEWANVAAGLVEEAEADARLDHAARCAYCGPLLREAIEDLAAEPSDEERRSLQLLPSAQEENQQRLAARLASTSGGSESRLTSRRHWAWAFVGAMAAALIFAAILFYGRLRNPYNSAGKLLADAYTANRNLELRVSGAAYAPISTVRGTNSSQPLPLLRAEVLIDRQLEAHPESAPWMALQGRAQLLQGQFDAARSTLQQALRLEPNSPSILTDLATAEYALSEQEGQSEQSMAAAEHLSEALKLHPEDPVALYNRALVYESIGSLPLALKDWERYLSLDPSSAWATNVARKHLDRLKKRLGSSPQSELPPSDPAAAAIWLANRLKQPTPPAGTMDSADEQLLDVAVTRWLPDAYATATPSAQRQAGRTALDRLAKELVKRHGDHWLEDVLSTPPSLTLTSGFAALGKAVRLNESIKPDEAEAQAARAESLFRAAENPAVLRAQLELVYALDRGSKPVDCVRRANALEGELNARRYPWIESQQWLDQASCQGMLQRVGPALRQIGRAMQIARASSYGTLELRSIAINAETLTLVGNHRLAWQWDRKGLDQYWEGEYPSIRAYEFYVGMEDEAEEAANWGTAEALGLEGVQAIAQSRYRSLEAIGRYFLARDALSAEDMPTAREELRRADDIFASLPPDPTFRIYQAYCRIVLARLEADGGQASRALEDLRQLAPLVKANDNAEMGLRFYSAQADAYLVEHDPLHAEQASLRAVAIAERSLRSLKTGAERVAWSQKMADGYRDLVRAELKGRSDPTSALGVWEWYRAGPIRAQTGEEGGPIGRLLPVSENAHGIPDASVSSAFRAELENWLRTARPGLGNDTVISYAQFPAGIQTWAFDDRGITARWVAVSQTEFERVARRFGQECANPKSSLTLLRSDGRQLYQWLIAPVESQLSPSRVLAFETDGAISGIPLQALVDGGGKYLGGRFAVIFSPGLGYEGVLRKETSIGSSDRILAIGAPALSGEWQSMFPPLPEADAEARAIAADFKSATLLTGGQATLQTVLHDLPETEILHFAGHALVEGGRTGLILAGSPEPGLGDSDHGNGAEVLAASQLDSRDLRECRLAVLSACSTASGAEAQMVDPGSLVGAFLIAGVPRVVASRWNVNSAATTRLMRVFYRRVLGGDSVALALRRADESVRENPETAHPYFWAAFSAYGRN